MHKILEMDQNNLIHSYNRFPIALTGGRGSILYDETGKAYIDLTSGIGVNTFGAADPVWLQAVGHQLGMLQHSSNLYANGPAAQLAKLLNEKTGMKKVFFSNSGAEANECAIKAARKYGVEKKGSDYFHIITVAGSFHGRTLGSLSATGQETLHAPYKPLLPGFHYTAPEDINGLKALLKAYPTAAIMLECIQGENGVTPLSRTYLQQVQALARQEGVILIIDEVQTGNGRTGALYSYMHFDLQPDMVTTAKGLGGGLPIGATLFSERMETIFAPGDHGSTFGGNPVCCAGALNILRRLDGPLLRSVREKGMYIRTALKGAAGIEQVTGMGLMVGVQTQKPVRQIALKCIEQGVLCLTAKERLRLLPPLNIPWEQLERAVQILQKVCAES